MRAISFDGYYLVDVVAQMLADSITIPHQSAH